MKQGSKTKCLSSPTKVVITKNCFPTTKSKLLLGQAQFSNELIVNCFSLRPFQDFRTLKVTRVDLSFSTDLISPKKTSFACLNSLRSETTTIEQAREV